MRYFAIVLMFLCNHAAAEMIGGHDLGGKFTRINEAERLQNIEPILSSVYSMRADSFFDRVEIETDKDNIIHGLAFTKEYSFSVATIGVEKRIIKKDFERLLAHLELRYGEFDKSGADRILSFIGGTNSFYMQKIMEAAILKRSQAPVVIALSLAGDESDGYLLGGEKSVTISLIYMDKVIEDAAKNANKAKNDLSGF